MKLKIYLFRHAQTYYNQKHIFTGWKDSKLTLFGEKQSRIVISFSPQSQSQIEQVCAEEQIPYLQLGSVGGTRFVIDSAVSLLVSELANAWHNGLQEPWNSRVTEGN